MLTAASRTRLIRQIDAMAPDRGERCTGRLLVPGHGFRPCPHIAAVVVTFDCRQCRLQPLRHLCGTHYVRTMDHGGIRLLGHAHPVPIKGPPAVRVVRVDRYTPNRPL